MLLSLQTVFEAPKSSDIEYLAASTMISGVASEMATERQQKHVADSDDESLRCFAINRDKKKSPQSKCHCALSQTELT